MEALQYPVGRFSMPAAPTPEEIRAWVEKIEQFPEQLRALTGELSPALKNRTYRPGGWSVKQLVHHCADSHSNSLIRFKLALTETDPVIKPYLEHLWANLPDSLDDDLSHSLQMLAAIHHKWVQLIRHFSAADFERGFVHPEMNTRMTLAQAVAMYAWHGEHHLAHIRLALND
ncbi:MAG: putative metal-dependent hydrolase [Bacteroidetes bacterium]|nr:MAG: putative metal-dependent hydrolase [Bacteroidota bacterium]